MTPINYSIQTPNPLQSVMEALKVGATIKGFEAEQQKAAQEQIEFQKQAERQDKFDRTVQKIFSGGIDNASAEDFGQLALLTDPKTAENVRNTFETMNKAAQQDTLSRGAEIYSALANKRPDVAKERLTQRLNLLKESQDPKSQREATYIERQLELIDQNPEFVQFDYAYKLAALPGGKDLLANVEQALKTRREEQLAPEKLKEAQQKNIQAAEKHAADLGLTKAQTNEVLAKTRNLGLEHKKAVAELEALNAGGGIPPEKRFDQEAKLRGEFQRRTGKYQELKGTFENINASAGAQTGPGDIALITSFMKMLDPGSVVRETEFATARDTAGLYAQLENNLQKAKDGKFLNPNQRKEYVNLARQYLSAAEKQANKERENLSTVVKNYKLNPENVFGAAQESVVVGDKAYSRPAGFTDAQWAQYKQAMGVK